MRGKMRSLLVVLALGLFLSACTYHGAIKEDFYHSLGGGGQKYPYKVAVVVDERAKSVQFHPVAYSAIYMDFDLYGAIGKAMQQEQLTVFEQVALVEEKSDTNGYDMLALVDIHVTSDEQRPPTITTKLDLTLKDLRDGVVLARQSKDFDFLYWMNEEQTRKAKLCTSFTILSLGLLSPVTVPCMTSAVGAPILASIEWQLPGLVRTVVANAKDELSLWAHVKQGLDGPKLTRGPAPRTVPSSDVDVVPSVVTPRNKPAYAIVVGIEQYRQKDLPRADFADHDAKVVREYLVKVLGFAEENVVLLSNSDATKSDMEKYVEHWLPNRVEQGDTVFVYFSGHGAPNTKTGDTYLVPFDGDPLYIGSTGYALKRLYDNLGKLPAKEVVVVLDSCFSGAGGRSVLAKGARPLVLSIDNAFLAGGKTVVLSAGSGDQISSTYYKQGHGLLTYYLLKGLQGEADRNKDGAIDLTEVFEYLRPQVQRVARREFNNEQSPQLAGSPEMLSKGIRLRER